MSDPSVPNRLPGSPHWPDGVAEDRTSWREFRKTLAPRYAMAIRQLILWYAVLLGSLWAVAGIGHGWGPGAGPAVALVLAGVIGFCLHALTLFGHEAAHYNLAERRGLNDTLADVFIWSLFAQTTASFRRSHWQHHLHLGGSRDTEISYHQCLDPWFLLKAATGMSLVPALLRYARANREPAASDAPAAPEGAGSVFAVGRTAAVHGVLVGLLWGWGGAVSAAVWVAAVLVAYPFFATLRQILEHRRADAPCDEDFRRSDHGPVVRMFARSPFARCFGAAGFDRHLLHHWEPTVSYTCFDEMEAFLERTALAGPLADARSTYGATLSEMIRSARNVPTV